MDFTGGKYDGETGGGRFDGHGTYTFPDGSKYVGQFKHGMFHGKGVIHNDVGSFAAVWDYGKMVKGDFTFKDGLPYEKENWAYCTPQDRRFYTEMNGGIKPAGECQLADTDKAPEIPEGCYDAGDGYYDPKRRAVFAYGTSGDQVRRPAAAEMKWLVAKCRVGTAPEAAAAPAAADTSDA